MRTLSTLCQSIGYYYEKGTTTKRPLDLKRDIRVSVNPDDQTELNYTYGFNLKYPILRVFGQYVADSGIAELS